MYMTSNNCQPFRKWCMIREKNGVTLESFRVLVSFACKNNGYYRFLDWLQKQHDLNYGKFTFNNNLSLLLWYKVLRLVLIPFTQKIIEKPIKILKCPEKYVSLSGFVSRTTSLFLMDWKPRSIKSDFKLDQMLRLKGFVETTMSEKQTEKKDYRKPLVLKKR